MLYVSRHSYKPVSQLYHIIWTYLTKFDSTETNFTYGENLHDEVL